MPRHVNVLGLLYLVWGGLFLLAGAVVLALAFGAVALLRYAAGEAGTELAAGLTAATFGTLAAIACRKYDPPNGRYTTLVSWRVGE